MNKICKTNGGRPGPLLNSQTMKFYLINVGPGFENELQQLMEGPLFDENNTFVLNVATEGLTIKPLTEEEFNAINAI